MQTRSMKKHDHPIKIQDFAIVASTSKQKYTPAQPTLQRQLEPVATTPPKRARTYSTIPTTIKQRLHNRDSGRCLITFENMPTASQQVAHIVARKTSATDLRWIEKMWEASPLNLDSTRNLVTLRADWHLSYDHDDWAFVPTEDILRKILKYKATSFDKPYPGFDPNELRDYVFVPLPTLGRHYIFRQMRGFKEDIGEGEGDDGDEHEGESGERGAGSVDEQEEGEQEEGEDDQEEGGGEEGEDEQEEGEDEGEDEQVEGEDNQEIGEGNATAYIAPFSDFPLLKHHAHPYFVINNALPKLRKYQHVLPSEHLRLLALMTLTEGAWLLRISKAPSSSKLGKRGRPRDEYPHDDDDDQPKRKIKRAAKGDRTKTYETRGRTDIGKGKARERGLGETTPAQPQVSTVKALRTRDFLFDDTSEVAAWAAAVAVAGPPEDTDKAVIWSGEEPVRKPVQKWDQWHVPYKQPKQWAKFCSSDWPMYFYSLPLWMPPYKKS